MVCHIKEERLETGFSVWVVAQSCCLMWWQMQSLDICRAVVLSDRVSGPSPAFQYSLRHTGEQFEVSNQSDVHVFGLWEEYLEYPEKQTHRNAEVTTKRRSFLPCRDGADLTFVMWGHRLLMEVWCNARIENHTNHLCIWTTGVRTQNDEDIKAPPLWWHPPYRSAAAYRRYSIFQLKLFTINLTLLSTFLSAQ